SAGKPLHTLSNQALGLDIEQLRRGPTEDIGFLVVAERSRSKNVVHRTELPGIGIIAAQNDLARTDLRRQMADRLWREYQRVEIELLQIFGRLLLQLDAGIASLRADHAGMIGAGGIRPQIAAAVGCDDLQP